MKTLFFIFLFPFVVLAQSNKVDSLEFLLESDTLLIEKRCDVLYAIALELKDSDYKKSYLYANKHLNIAVKNNLIKNIAAANNFLGILSRAKGEYEKAITLQVKALKIYDSLGLKKDIAMLHNNIGVTQMYNEAYPEATKNYNEALELSIDIKDTNVMKMAINNLGIIACYQSEFQRGIIYFKKSLHIEESLSNKKGISECMSNIGAAFFYLEITDSALFYFNKGLEIERQTNDIPGIAGSLSNLSEVYMAIGKPDLAEKNLLEAVKITKKNQIAAVYIDALFNISSLYESKNDFENALKYNRVYIHVKDSIHSLKKKKQIAEIQTKYETEKKEKKLAQQHIELTQQELKVKNRNIQLVALAGGLLLLLLFGGFVYKNQKEKQIKLKQQIALEQAESINKVQNEKLRISRDLHDNIGSQLTFVISSLDNMDYIKDEGKRKEKLNLLASFTKDTMNELRETIWAIKSESITQEELITKASEFIDKAKMACPSIDFKIITSKTNFKLNSNQAINVYRTIQEGINNAIKYSQANEITLISEKSKITISDNGIGFNKSTIKSGNGMINIYARMKEVGFKSEIYSEIEKGTKVTIHFT